LRAPQGCLRSVRRPRERPTTWILCPSHLSTPRHSDSHPRGCPTIHLSKSFSHTSPTTFVAFAVLFPVRFFPSGEAESYRRFRHCQPGVAKIFSTLRSTARRSQAPVGAELIGVRPRRTLLPSAPRVAPYSVRTKKRQVHCEEVFNRRCRATGGLESLFAAVQSPRLILGRW